MAKDVVFHYYGDGEYIAGVPARDLTQRDIDGLDPTQRRDLMQAKVVRWSGNTRKEYPLYAEKVKPSGMAKAIAPADPAKVRADEEQAALEAAAETPESGGATDT